MCVFGEEEVPLPVNSIGDTWVVTGEHGPHSSWQPTPTSTISNLLEREDAVGVFGCLLEGPGQSLGRVRQVVEEGLRVPQRALTVHYPEHPLGLHDHVRLPQHLFI